MAPVILQPRPYNTPFKRHLAFFDLDNDGTIYIGESLRACLSLGLNFPASLVMASGMQMIYGNTRPIFFGPFNGIDISKVPRNKERYMLDDIEQLTMRRDDDHRGLTCQELVSAARIPGRGLMDQMHVLGIWAIAADKEGRLNLEDMRLARQGCLMNEIMKRRKDRSDVLPFLRGGPIGIGGHSWFCEKTFGVRVYQEYQRINGKEH
jgi:hypothetical protein